MYLAHSKPNINFANSAGYFLQLATLLVVGEEGLWGWRSVVSVGCLPATPTRPCNFGRPSRKPCFWCTEPHRGTRGRQKGENRPKTARKPNILTTLRFNSFNFSYLRDPLPTLGNYPSTTSGGIQDEAPASNLISNDPLVAAIFAAVNAVPAEPLDRLLAVLRAGRIAEAYAHGGVALIIDATFGKSSESHL